MSWASAYLPTTLVDQLPTTLVDTPVHTSASLPASLTLRPSFMPTVVDWAHLVVLDFETYYDVDYTLSKLSTSEYIRDPRFHAHMVGVKIGRKKAVVIPRARLAKFLAAIDWSTHDLLCHNTAFDGFILSHHLGIVPRRYYDTLSMARGLHSNDIGAALDDVARHYGVGNKVAGVLEQSKGVRVLGKELYARMAAYCRGDVELTLAIFKRMVAQFPAVEADLVDATIRMFCDPVLRVDIPRVQCELARELAERETLLLSIDTSQFDERKLTKLERELPPHEKRLLIARKIVGSNDAFSDLLRACGVAPPLKISPAWLKTPKADRDESKKWAYAFAKDDADFTELPDRPEEWSLDLDLDDPSGVEALAARQARLQQLVEVRLAVKSTTNLTRAERFLTAGKDGMCLPAGYAYYRAHTGRWGGNNKMNLQNLTRGGELRLSILAPPGHVLVVGDSGQIECRVNGWLWGQDDLLHAFRESDAGRGRDAYCNFGDIIYKRGPDNPVTKDDKVERFVAKVATLGLGFMMGPSKFQITLARGALGGPPVYFDLARCKVIVNEYRRKNHRIAAGWDVCSRIIEDMAAGRAGAYKCLSWEADKIWLPNAMALHYPDLQQRIDEESGWPEWTYAGRNGARKKIYGGLLCENIVQALARIVVAEQLLAVTRPAQGKMARRLVMITNDEGVLAVPQRSGPAALRELMAAMKTPLSWCPDLPLNSEGGFAHNYSK